MIYKKNMYDRIAKIPGYLILLFTVFVSIFPILWVFVSSFKTNKAILSSPFSLPDAISIQPYIDVFTQYNFAKYFGNSLLISLVSTAAALFIYALAAYVIARYEFRGKNLLYVLFTITLLVPHHAKAQPIFSLIFKMGLYDTKSALILVYTSTGMALALFILRATFMTIPKSLDEAALIDGCNFWQIFWKVNVPLARSGLATAGILMFLANWNEYFYAVILISGEKNRTLPVALGFFNEAFSYNYTKMFAALTIVVVPGIILYLLAQEQVQKSVASSGVKG